MHRRLDQGCSGGLEQEKRNDVEPTVHPATNTQPAAAARATRPAPFAPHPKAPYCFTSPLLQTPLYSSLAAGCRPLAVPRAAPPVCVPYPTAAHCFTSTDITIAATSRNHAPHTPLPAHLRPRQCLVFVQHLCPPCNLQHVPSAKVQEQQGAGGVEQQVACGRVQ